VLGKDVVLVVINDILLDQYIRLLRLLQLSELVVIHVKDLGNYLGKNKFIVFDEYYNELVNTKISFKNGKGINPIFLLGDKREDLIFISGHHSGEFNSFLNAYYPGNVDIQINKSIPQLFGQPAQKYTVTLELYSSFEIVKQKAVECIRSTAQSKPVFVLGIDWDEGETFGLDPDNSIVTRFVPGVTD
jgi:hypothetical protein